MSEFPKILRDRLNGFRPSRSDGISMSIKVRVTSGCFHREHSPHAYRIIDQALRRSADEIRFEEHESGPELLLWLALGTGGITLVKSVIDFLTTIIKARSEGREKGDHPYEPLELVVRGFRPDGEMFDEVVLKIGSEDKPSRKEIEDALTDGIEKHLKIVPIDRPAKRKERT